MKTNAEPQVSCIIIFWNAEKYLGEAIESVFAQTYPNLELLLVDDGSTDGGTVIAREVAQKFPARVRYLEHEGHANRGMSASRNLGIQHASGQYVTFLDADDRWTGQPFAEMRRMLEDHPEAMLAYGATHWWYGWDPGAAGSDFVHALGVDADRVVAPPDLLVTTLRDESMNPAGSLFRRDVFKEVGGFEENFRGMYEDQVFYAKVLLRYPAYVSSSAWYQYRKHRDQCCAVAVSKGENHLLKLRYLMWLRNYMREQQIREPAVERALRQEIFRIRHPRLKSVAQRLHEEKQKVKKILRPYVIRKTIPSQS